MQRSDENPHSIVCSGPRCAAVTTTMRWMPTVADRGTDPADRMFCGEGIPESGSINLGIVGRVTSTGALDTYVASGTGSSVFLARIH
jgi:hypothetical protein